MNAQPPAIEDSGQTPVELKPPCRLLIWRLAAAGGGEWIGDLRPAPSATVRKELLDSGLAQGESRRNQETGRPGTWIELTEAGWAWTTEHLGADIGAGSAAGDTLTVMLRGLGQFLAAHQLTAADVFRRRPEELGSRDAQGDSIPEVFIEEDPVLSPMVEAAVVRAYLLITGGRDGVRVLLKHLRPSVELTREELDSVLRLMAEDGRLRLETLPETNLTAEDRDAVVRGYRGESFHILCLEA